MTVQHSREIKQCFNRYIARFRDSNGVLPPMQRLKFTHTMRVVKDARRIMTAETWPNECINIGEIGALLHDVGRFSQFAEFGTFRDSESIDHADRGVAVIREEQMLHCIATAEAHRIIEAVRWHNKKTVPQDLEEKTAKLTHLIRDADKLDIFRVMEQAITDGSIMNNPEITWGLAITKPPNEPLVEAILRGEAVDYALIQSLSDFILIQIGWIISGFHNRSALHMVRERHVIEFRRKYLKKLSSSPAIDRCCDAAQKALTSV